MENQIEAGDVIVLWDAHPCGGVEWDVLFAGYDLRLRCRTCGQQITLPRSVAGEYIRRLRKSDAHKNRDASAVSGGKGKPAKRTGGILSSRGRKTDGTPADRTAKQAAGSHRNGAGENTGAAPSGSARPGTGSSRQNVHRSAADTRRQPARQSSSGRSQMSTGAARRNSTAKKVTAQREPRGRSVQSVTRRRRSGRSALAGNIPALAVLIVLAIILISGIAVLVASRPKKEALPDTATGLEYLRTLENTDMEPIENQLAALRQKHLEEDRDRMLAELTSGSVDVWSLFTDYALMGDSRAVGFEYYGYMPDDRVIADAGWTIRNIEEHMDELKALHPSSIFLCFGLNDTSIGIWQTPQEYAAEYQRILERLYSEIPNVTVYVNSTLPARDPAFLQSEKWYEIPDYSAAVGRMCAEKGIPFVDNDDIAEKYSDLWDLDGIHLQVSFYPYWAANMMMTVYSYTSEQS